MTALFISLFTLVLLIVSAFVVLIVLMQRTSNSGGMGSALGGGATEQVLGAETSNVLTKGTIYGIIAFFVIALGLHIGYLSTVSERPSGRDAGALAGQDEEEVGVIEQTLPVVPTEEGTPSE
jgi:preprotein translocase subunit SecG